MPIVVVSKIRTVRDAISRAVLAGGYDGSVNTLCFSSVSSSLFSRPPRLLFISAAICDGIKLVQQFRAAHPAVNVGVLAMGDDDNEFIAWAGTGISGYVEADASAEVIAGIILRLAAGESIIPARLSSLLLHHFARRNSATEPSSFMHLLTRRETEVVALIVDGLSNKQIARRLIITDATVKNHVHNILEKLDVPSRGAAAAYIRRLSVGHSVSDLIPRAAAARTACI